MSTNNKPSSSGTTDDRHNDHQEKTSTTKKQQTNNNKTQQHDQQPYYKYKTLGSLLKYWEGMEIAVELKTGRIYQGILEHGDVNCSIMLQDVTHGSHGNNNETNNTSIIIMPLLHIRGSKIRYIHFLESKKDGADNLARRVKLGMERERHAKQKYKRGIRKSSSTRTTAGAGSTT